jgi:hypothetical protein
MPAACCGFCRACVSHAHAGLDGRLESWAAAAAAAEGGAGGGGGRLCLSNAPAVLLDPPLAVRRLQDREAMLAPLAGQQLMFTQQVKTGHCGAGPQGEGGVQDRKTMLATTNY